MKRPVYFFLISILLFVSASFAQQATDIEEYIKEYKDLAIAEMQRTGIPASIKLAQGIHETGAGTSDLVKRSNNHFGLKCKSEWTGMTVKHTDDAPNECFRKYNNPYESYIDQSDYLKKSPRYAFLFSLDPTDYKGWAYGLKKAGYATNPKYSQVLIKLVEDYNLQDYTLIALGKLQQNDLAQKEIKTTEFPPDIKLVIEKPVELPPEPEIIVYAKRDDAKKPEVKKQDPIVEQAPQYPDGDFKINETRVIYAKNGTSFLSIAEKYNVPLARIFEFNDNMKVQEFVDKDQLIYIMRKRKTGLNAQHTVKPGETLADIAQTEALRIESLLEYNNLQQGVNPAVGTVLYLQSKAPATQQLGK